MNTNEIIERLKSKNHYIVRGNQSTRDWTIEVTVDERDEIIRELNRFRIRITKDELPTREDADKEGNVLAYDLLSESWVKMSIIAVVADRTYTKWTKLPEVTP